MSVEIQTMGEGGIFEIAAVVIDEVLEIQPFTDVEYEILSSARDILAAGSILEAATVATNSANTAAGLASEAASAANDAAGLANSATTSANTAAGAANSAATSATSAAGAANTAASSANSAASAANTAAATAASFVGTGPAGYYATLTALQAAYPTGDTGIYVELEYGHWYYWSGSAWIDGGLFQAPLAVVQTTGTSETDVMSQKAVTDELALKADQIETIIGSTTSEVNGSTSINHSTPVTINRIDANDIPCLITSEITKIKVNVGAIGEGRIYIIDKIADSTDVKIVREFSLNFDSVGINEFEAGIDFDKFIINKGQLIGFGSKEARINYSNALNIETDNIRIIAVASNILLNKTFSTQISNHFEIPLQYESTPLGTMGESVKRLEDIVFSEIIDKDGYSILDEYTDTSIIESEKYIEDTGSIYNLSGVNSDKILKEILSNKQGIVIEEARENLFPSDNFETLEGWDIIETDGGSITIDNSISFNGKPSLKMVGGASGFTQVTRINLTLDTNAYYTFLAVYYSPDKILRFDDIRIVITSGYPVNFKIFELDKKGWYIVTYQFKPSVAINRYGLQVNAGITVNLAGLAIYKSDQNALRLSQNKEKDGLKFKVSADRTFTYGFITRVSGFAETNGEDRVLSEMVDVDGNSLKITYKSSTKSFYATSIIDGITKQANSGAVDFNPTATLGIAVCQTRSELRLYINAPRGIVVDFDDGYMNNYTNAFLPIMKDLDIKGTIHVITNSIDNSTNNYLSDKELQILKAHGWAIDSHLMEHIHLSELSEIEQIVQIEGAINWLKERGLDYDTIATPFGDFNDTTLKIFRDLGVKMHRGYSSLGYDSNSYPVSDRYKIKSDPVSNVELASETIARVDGRMETYKYMHLTFHGINEGEETLYYHPDKLKEVMIHLRKKNYPLYTFSEIASKHKDRKQIGNVEEFVVGQNEKIKGQCDIYIGSDKSYENYFNATYADFFFVNDELGIKELMKKWEL